MIALRIAIAFGIVATFLWLSFAFFDAANL